VHGGNLIKLIFALLTFAIALPTWSLELSETIDISNKDLDLYINSKRFNISSSEKKTARNLTTIFDISTRGYTNSKLTKKLLRDVKKSRAFYIYTDWLNSIIQIDASKSVSFLQNKCTQLIDKDSKNIIKNLLIENATNLCLKKYLRELGKVDGKSIKHFKEFKFVHANIGMFLNRDNKESFKFFLSKLEKRSYSHKEYSKLLTQHYIQKDLSPEKDLIQYIHITPDFTRYVQMRGVEDYSTNYLFHEELEKLIKTAFSAAEDKKDKKEVLELTKKALNYYNLSQQYLPKRKSKKHVLSLGKSLLRRHYYKSAIKVYDSLLANYKNEEDLIFEKMWVYLTREQYSEAYANVIKPYKLDKRYEKIQDERLHFWTALTLKENYKSSYKPIFENLIKKSPLSYYSIISSKLLSDKYKLETDQIFYKNAYDHSIAIKKLPAFDKYTIRSLKRLKIWGDMDFKPFIRLEYDNLENIHAKEIARINSDFTQAQAKTALNLLGTRILNRVGNHLESFKAVYNGINERSITLDRTVLENLFPKPYAKSLNRYKKNIDPVIALSLIRQESGFNKRARSHAGARGLMQIMPATARRFQRIKASQLYRPYLNLKIGTKLLNQLYSRYDQNLVYTLSAYNAGETRVKRWRKRYLTNDSILHNIENIPFLETRKYVKLIFRNIFFYKMLDETKEQSDSKKTNHIYDIYLGFNSIDN